VSKAKPDGVLPTIQFKTSFGWVTASATKRGVSALHLGPRRPAKGSGAAASPVLKKLKSEVTAYFEGRQHKFTLPLDLSGATEFSRAVLKKCAAIPYGKTASYSGLAKAVGNPQAARAVGRVMARNPIPIVIPCHRVVGADGSLTGFGGGIGLKSRLLALEQRGRSRGR
jgi:methylated-DNA-[protein]-cysteine S-methyltransferase